MATLRKLLNYIYPNPTQVANKFIKGNNVTYGLLYEDDNNGRSKVKLLISRPYQTETYEWDTGLTVSNEFIAKHQLSLILTENSAEADKIGIIFPEEADKKGSKYIKSLSFNTYEIEQSISAPLVKHLSTTKLQKYINNNPTDSDNSYSQPQATKVNSGIVVTAKDLEDETIVAWYLPSNKNGALAGKKGRTERKLFKLNNLNSEFALSGNILLYSQVNNKIIDNHKVETTDIFASDITDAIKDIKKGRGTDEYLLSSHKAPFFSIEGKISSLQHIAQTKSIAFLEQNPSSDTKKLHIMSLNDGRSSFIYEFTSPIEQLYVQENARAGIVVTAVNKENITSVYIDNFQRSPRAIITPTNEVQKLSDFINIIDGRLPPHIASSTTLATITTSTKRTTSATKPTTEISTKKETTVSTTTKVSEITETKPVQFETTTIHQTTEPSTNKPTTEAKKTSKTTKTTTTVHRITTFTKPSIHTLTTTQIPFTEKTTSPTAHPAIANVGGSNNAGIVVGSIVGAFGVIGLMAFGIYRCIQHYRDKNSPPPLLRLEKIVPGIELENIENRSETPPLS